MLTTVTSYIVCECLTIKNSFIQIDPSANLTTLRISTWDYAGRQCFQIESFDCNGSTWELRVSLSVLKMLNIQCSSVSSGTILKIVFSILQAEWFPLLRCSKFHFQSSSDLTKCQVSEKIEVNSGWSSFGFTCKSRSQSIDASSITLQLWSLKVFKCICANRISSIGSN